jgi:hypothetical protein
MTPPTWITHNGKRLKIAPTTFSLNAFHHFAECLDTKRLPSITGDPNGYTAAECFHAHETHGVDLPCREPVLLSRALNGKEWHGVTVTAMAEDYVGRILFAEDLKKLPTWIAKDVLGRASQIAMQRVGFVPTFVRTGQDFTTLKP